MLGKYELLGELGRGAFGVVYRARDAMINRMVALKTMSAFVADDSNLLQRFYREAQSAGSLQHPNIVTIYDMGHHDGSPYIAMELIDGQNLDDLITSGPALPISLKLQYALQACRAFDYAHQRGIIHRDIKPGNVMVNKEGVVKVVDFGIARVLENSKTQTGMLIGTFSYMAPEVFHGEHANARSDIWSFGVLLYELLSCRRPFAGESPAALMQCVCNKEPLPLRQLVPECPEDLEAVVHRMLVKSEPERIQSMEEVILELDTIWRRLQEDTVTASLQRSQQLFEEGEFVQAREALRAAMQLNPSSQQARSLYEKINAELKRMSIRVKAQEHVEKGRSLLQEHSLQEALAEADQALSLDSSFEAAQELQREAQREIDRTQLINDWLEGIEQRLAEGLPDEAEELLAKVREADPSNRQAPVLQQQIQEERERRQRQARLSESVQQARALWSRRKYQDCIILLTDLQREFPGEEEIERLLETARDDQIEQNKQERLTEARHLLAGQHHAECLVVLSKLQTDFPGDDEIRRLLDAARADEADQNKEDRLAQARTLLAEMRYEDCIALLTSLRQGLHREEDIEGLLDTARYELAEQNRQRRLTEVRKTLAERRYADCAALLMELQHDFPGDGEVQRLLEATREYEAEQGKRDKLAEARKLLAARSYAKCIAALTEIQSGFPDDGEVQRLLQVAQSDQAEQDKRKKLAEARKLLSARCYEECTALLGELQKEFPNDEEVGKSLDTARQDQAEFERKRKLTEARDLVAAQQFVEAMEVLEPLLAADPKDSAVVKLRSIVQRELEKHTKSENLRRAWETLKRLVGDKNYAQAIADGEALLREFPGEADLMRMVEFARSQQAQAGRELRLRNSLKQAQDMMKAGRFGDAAAAARAGLEAFPDHPGLASLLQQAQAQEKKETLRQLIERRVREIKVKINQGELSEARQLAKEALERAGPDTDVQQLLASAEVEYEAREKSRRKEQKVEAIRGLLQAGKLDDAASQLDAALKGGEYNALDLDLWRLADEIESARKAAASKFVTQHDGAEKVTTEYGVYDEAEKVTTEYGVYDEADRPAREYAFLDGPPLPAGDVAAAAAQPAMEQSKAPQPELTSPRGADMASPANRSVISNEAPAATPASARGELTPEAINRAAALLARHVGPISRVLAKRAAPRADSLHMLYQLLGEHVGNKADRARFLRDAGFPES